MKITAENGRAFIQTPTGVLRFNPKGKAMLFGMNPAHADIYGIPSNAARMFVGFNVGKKPTHNVNQLSKLYQRERAKQKNDKGDSLPPDASFVIQKGLYTSPVDGIVYENSVQLIVLSLFGESEKIFTDNMIEIAGVVARDFHQEVVILEMQKYGIAREVYGVSWKE